MRRAGFGVVALGVVAGLLTPVSAAAQDVEVVKSVGVRLPVEDLRAVELDEDRGRLYVAQGVGGGDPLVVTDLDGRLVERVPAVTDLSDLALSDDRGTLLAAQAFSGVTALHADTLTVSATYPAPEGACVYTVEPSGDKVVGGFVDCGYGSGGLLVWSRPGVEPVVYTAGPDHRPVIDASPGAPGLLVAGDTGISPVTTYVLDVSGDAPRIVSRREDTGSNLRDYALSPDGTQVVQTVGHPYEHRAYRVPDLSDAVVYPSGVYPADAAWSGDGSTVAIGRASTSAGDPDLYLYDRDGTTPKYAVDFHPDDVLWDGTLLVSRDGTRAWAVSYDDVYQDVQLLHSFGPAHAPNAPVTDLSVRAVTGTGKDKATAFITVDWTSPTGEDDYWWITASTNGGPEREFWRGPMAPGGPHALTYALPAGTTTFTVRYKDFWSWYPDGHSTTTVRR
ncbi:TolB family protein [Actinosynnema sp. NPDC091369]